jgi:hypothetical protein
MMGTPKTTKVLREIMITIQSIMKANQQQTQQVRISKKEWISMKPK